MCCADWRLLDRQHRIADLEVRLNHLEAEWSAERERADRLAAAHPNVSELLRERDVLQDEVARLCTELLAAQEQHSEAEERCALLERQLEAVEQVQRTGVPMTGTAPAPQGMPKILVV
ncbi:response regulator, partial [Streptomyces sp. NPDC085665]